ncbi:dentin sialophosphoprotein-like [Palaemon carinicauda]|uniref:dentin sialophosphoprotein-like n=1 Tax=Palaemon carinicauda TaxID=392227 RepID=UPI0035B58827
MGGLRAAVGVVLGVISLAVLSLHIALCIHYPSPLFAVTLLLNPSLWLFLGLIGMGCALLLTHRDQQRKVRAGHCTTCHPHYGSTVDTKWRAQDPKWRGGGMPCQRGPSRAIYSYNGNLHKFYASYGAINEKQLIEMKHATSKSPHSTNDNDKTPNLPSEETNGTQGDTKSTIDEAGVKTESGNLCKEEEMQSKDEKNSDGRVCGQVEGKDSGVSENPTSCIDSRKGDEIGAEKESQNNLEQKSNSTDTAAASAPVIPPLSPREMYYRERRYCDCMARYGAIYQYSQVPRSALSPRCNRYAMQDRTMSRYNSKLLMRCKLKPPNDVPVELFAAKGVSSGQVSSEADKDGNSDAKKSEASTRDSVNDNQELDLDKSSELCSNSICPSQKTSQVSEEEVSSVGCTDSTSLSSMADLSAPKESIKSTPHTAVSSSFIVPLKHMPRFTTQTSTSLPLGSPYNGKSKHTADYVDDHESTSLSSDHTASEKDFQDQDVVSISSKSSLLPSSPEKSVTNRDLTRSPLWRPFRSSIMGRKRLSDEERNSNEDISKNNHSKGYSTGNDSTNEDSQESPSSTLKSVFSNRKSFSKLGGDNRKTSPLSQSNSNENISSASTSSSASPAMKEKRRQQVDSSRPTKCKSSFSRKISAAKSQSLQKNSKTLLLSPARAVRSLVFRNSQKRSGRVRKLQDEKSQGDCVPAKLPLLSSPNTEPIPLEKSIATAHAEYASDSAKIANNPSLSSAADASKVSESDNALEAASTFCSTSSVPSRNSNALSQVAGAKVSNNSSTVTWSFSKADNSAKERCSSASAQETSSRFAASEPTVKTPLISSPATCSTSPAVATPPATTMASSSSPCGSPSVRPKEPKKSKIRLKGKHRPRPTESILLLTADSDE